MGRELAIALLLAFPLAAGGSGEIHPDGVVLPVEVLGEDGTTVSRTFTLTAAQSESVRSLWLQVHGLRYPEQGSVQVNASPWIPVRNETVTIAEPGRSYGGIGGGFATLVLTLPLAGGVTLPGTNIIRFRFNQTDGLSSGYRVLAFNFLTADGNKVLPPVTFTEDAPEAWAAPHPDAASIRAGRELWHRASLVANSLPNSPRIQAHCADCHALDGRDLKYFNFSNASIIARSRFHGLTTLEGEEIASYIRSLPVPNPGRPWNPPYQPGPHADEQPVSHWAAGEGLTWVLERDTDALPYLLREGTNSKPKLPAKSDSDLDGLTTQITPEIFRPDGNLNPREIPISLQLPDWSQWLPRIHPKDAWGAAFARSELATIYDGGTIAEGKSGPKSKSSLRKLVARAQARHSELRSIVPAFARWSQSKHAFLRHFVKPNTVWSADLTNEVYSTQLWQLVKTWEMMQEFGLEGRGGDVFGPGAESRTWFSSIPGDTAPAIVHIPSGPTGVGRSALTNEYLSSSWYELQIILNHGNHRHRDRTPVDWVYFIGQFRNLYLQSNRPEPVRLLVAVTKALQSTDPHLGPDDYRQGWRPDQNVDPRIMISAEWAPFFKPLPFEVRRTLTESLLTAWMDKTLQYPIPEYLPMGSIQRDYKPQYAHRNISGGNVWVAARAFRAAGVSDDLVDRLLKWGIAYTDRADSLQYH
jgi:hypothetical protein